MGGEGRAQVAAPWNQRWRGRGRGRQEADGKGEWGAELGGGEESPGAVRSPLGQGLLPAQCQG